MNKSENRTKKYFFALFIFVHSLIVFLLLSSTYKCNFLGADNKQ